MTREEAINLEAEVRYSLTASNHKEAVDVAFSALREQEERSKGCEWCEPKTSEDGWPETLLIGLPSPNKFCPNCGRKPEVEG